MKKLIPNISKMAIGGEPPKGVKPIYVSDENDKRLKSYRDSLDAYNTGQQSYKFGKQIYDQVRKPINDEFRKNYTIKQIKNNHREKNPYGDTGIYPISGYTEKYIQKPISLKNKLFGNTPNKYYVGNDKSLYEPVGTTWSVFAKPIQPVEYRPKVTPTVVAKPKSRVIPKITPIASNKKIQMETTKLDTTPVVQPTLKTPPIPLTKKQYYEVPDANGKVTLLTPEQFSRMSSGNKNDLMSKSPIMNKPKYFYEMNNSGKRQLVPESKIREYMQTKNK